MIPSDVESGGEIIEVATGKVIAAKAPSVLRCSALGSCVAVVLSDKGKKVGGLAHVMLPSNEHVEGRDLKYSDHAITELVRQMVKLGARPGAIKARLVGGAHMLKDVQDVGKENIASIKRILNTLKIRVTGERIGGSESRSVLYDVLSGEVYVKEKENKFTI
ncbi:MAG: chemotaxis protein CheD [Candidatus Vogelbacteria bacterium]|nr:chemotaxis protein CheD [Candidatus Vogelbacteria bacterium]